MLKDSLEQIVGQTEIIELFKQQLDDFESEATSKEDIESIAQMREALSQIENKVESVTNDVVDLIGRLLAAAPAKTIFIVEANAAWDWNLLPRAGQWDVREYSPAIVGLLRCGHGDTLNPSLDLGRKLIDNHGFDSPTEH